MDKYILKPSLREKFSGIIWKVEVDTLLPFIAIETRDFESHKAGFSLYNFKSGNMLFREFQPEGNWSLGLEKVHGGIVYLHGYVSETSPEHKGIIALNSDAKTIWHAFNKTLYDLSDSGLVAYNPGMQPRQLELLNPEDGSYVKNLSGYQSLVPEIIIPGIAQDALEIPAEIDKNNVAGPVVFSLFNEKSIIAFHSKTSAGFNQQLLVYEGGKLIFKDFLALDIQKMNPEAFFIFQNHLFCIRGEKREIVSYLV